MDQGPEKPEIKNLEDRLLEATAKLIEHVKRNPEDEDKYTQKIDDALNKVKKKKIID